MTIATPRRALLDVNGRPIQVRPPEKISAVKFIRKLAEEAGGITRPQGAALHRLAGHMIRLQEELERVSHLHDLQGDHTPERIEASARGIYAVASEQVTRSSEGRIVPQPWDAVVAERPAEAEVYRTMALAALGGPVFPPVGDAEDMRGLASSPDPG